MPTNYPYGPQHGLDTLLQTNTNLQAASTNSYSSQGLYGNPLANSYLGQPTYYPMPVRNSVTIKISGAMAERNIRLSDMAKEMAGDYDKNRKLLSDLFLTPGIHMTMEQATCVAFAAHVDTHEFIADCEREGYLLH